MPSNIPATTIRIEPEVKREASAILDELGLSMSTAMNMFLHGDGGSKIFQLDSLDKNITVEEDADSLELRILA